MVVGRRCFSGARRFAQFEAGGNLDPQTAAASRARTSGAAAKSRHELVALCWAYCLLWIQRAKANQQFLVGDLVTIGCRTRAAMRATSSDVSRALLALGSSPTDMGMTLVLLLSKSAVKTCLDAYAAQGGSFVILTLERCGWSHVIAIKLNRFALVPSPVWSQPCAIFDPNVGQGVYSNHADLAADLLCLVQAYGMVSSIRAQVLGP